MPVDSNVPYYPTPPFQRHNVSLANKLYLVEVLSVDFDQRRLTVKGMEDGLVYSNVTVFPANLSSMEGIDINMPEQGTIGVACNLTYEGGFRNTIVVSWVHSQTYVNIDAIASRPVKGDRIQGWSNRLRGTYRKAYPGQKSASYTGGYTEKIDTAWDRQAADWTRDRQDPDKRQWTQIAGRRVHYSDAGVAYQGTVNRPGAGGSIVPVLLPDGTQEYVPYLAPGTQPIDRYRDKKKDVIAFSEHTELVQEFALDYPVPYEILQTSLLDTVLGVTASPWPAPRS